MRTGSYLESDFWNFENKAKDFRSITQDVCVCDVVCSRAEHMCKVQRRKRKGEVVVRWIS